MLKSFAGVSTEALGDHTLMFLLDVVFMAAGACALACVRERVWLCVCVYVAVYVCIQNAKHKEEMVENHPLSVACVLLWGWYSSSGLVALPSATSSPQPPSPCHGGSLINLKVLNKVVCVDTL